MNLNEEQLKKRNIILKWVGLILSAIPPIILACFLINIDSDIITWLIHVLWCGFYGCILLWWSHESKVLKWIMTVLNVFPFLFLAIGSLMGGIMGPIIVILKTVIWYVPYPSTEAYRLGIWKHHQTAMRRVYL